LNKTQREVNAWLSWFVFTQVLSVAFKLVQRLFRLLLTLVYHLLLMSMLTSYRRLLPLMVETAL
jgi:hypothetical protein